MTAKYELSGGGWLQEEKALVREYAARSTRRPADDTLLLSKINEEGITLYVGIWLPDTNDDDPEDYESRRRDLEEILRLFL